MLNIEIIVKNDDAKTSALMIRMEKSQGSTAIILDNDIIPDIRTWTELFKARKDKLILFKNDTTCITAEKDDGIFRIVTVHSHTTTVFACLADMIGYQLCKKIAELSENSKKTSD